MGGTRQRKCLWPSLKGWEGNGGERGEKMGAGGRRVHDRGETASRARKEGALGKMERGLQSSRRWRKLD